MAIKTEVCHWQNCVFSIDAEGEINGGWHLTAVGSVVLRVSESTYTCCSTWNHFQKKWFVGKIKLGTGRHSCNPGAGEVETHLSPGLAGKSDLLNRFSERTQKIHKERLRKKTEANFWPLQVHTHIRM